MEENIDFEQNTITIRHTVTSCDLDGKRVLVASDTTKTKSSILLLIKQKQINGGETGEYRINHFSARCNKVNHQINQRDVPHPQW